MVRYAVSAHETVTVLSAGADALEVEAVYAANGKPAAQALASRPGPVTSALIAAVAAVGRLIRRAS